jgi:hypothetical protein
MLLINNERKEKRSKKFLSHMSFVFGHFSCLPKKELLKKTKKKVEKVKEKEIISCYLCTYWQVHGAVRYNAP